MRVTVFGTGYVGLVTGTCLAEVGHDVICVDIDAAKVEGLNAGVVPIYEPGLTPMVQANHAAGRLRFTTDAAAGIAHGEVLFIAVGTPPDEDGSADLQYVLAVARTIGRHLARPAVVVDKSTVPVGTADKVRTAIAAELAARGTDIAFDVVSNPEFLKEGAAVEDCMRPDRIVIGTDSAAALEKLIVAHGWNDDPADLHPAPPAPGAGTENSWKPLPAARRMPGRPPWQRRNYRPNAGPGIPPGRRPQTGRWPGWCCRRRGRRPWPPGARCGKPGKAAWPRGY